MSTWKKIIVSGSQAHLSSVTASNGSIISGSLTMSGSITNVDNLDFNTAPPAALDATVTGRLSWNSGIRDLTMGVGNNVEVSLGQSEWAYVYNAEGTTLNKGEVVYVSGSQGNVIAVKRASDASDGSTAGTLGVVGESIAAGGNGVIIVNGLLRKLNTIGLTEGSLLYVGTTPGTYTTTKPISPQHEVRVGYVVRVHATVGEIYVKVDNGYEIGELHDVIDTTTTASYGDLLIKSGSVWTNSKQLTGSYGLTGSLEATSFTGSLQGSSSYATQALSASFATTASYVLGGGGVSDGDKGDITVSSGGSTWTIDNDVVTFAKMQNISPGVLGRQSAGSGDITTLTALTDYHVLQWISGAPFWSTITTNNIQISNDNRILGKGTGLASELSLGNGLAISGTTLFVTSSAFTGSLQGTASYATQALSSSFATNSSTASYVLNAVSASFATNASTSSYVLNAVSASFATTASYVLGGGGASVTNPGNNYIITSDGTVGGLVGETNLLFDGSTLNVTGSAIISATTRLTDIEERELTVTIGGTPSSLSLDLSQANVFEVTYNNNVNSFSITNPPPTNYAGSFTLVTTGTGIPYPWNWGSAVTWSGGSAPSVTSTNGKRDIYGFITTNQGTNWYGFIGGQNL